jgi:hypothetical protein
MRKPISKHALRRALESVEKEGRFESKEPIGSLVDGIWHELGKKAYNSPKKKPVSRKTVRKPPASDLGEIDSAAPAGGEDA